MLALTIDLVRHRKQLARFDVAATHDHRHRYEAKDNDEFMETVVEEHPEMLRARLRQYAQSGALTHAEGNKDPASLTNEDTEEPLGIPNELMLLFAIANPAYRTLLRLLDGLHSVNIRTNRGSIYRMRFVAPEPCTSAPATKTPTSSASEKTPDTKYASATYPLLAVWPDFTYKLEKVHEHQSKYIGVETKLVAKFDELVQAEMEVLDGLTTSDSSSVTETNWMHPTCIVYGTAGVTVKYSSENLLCHTYPSNLATHQLKWMGRADLNESKTQAARRMYSHVFDLASHPQRRYARYPMGFDR